MHWVYWVLICYYIIGVLVYIYIDYTKNKTNKYVELLNEST